MSLAETFDPSVPRFGSAEEFLAWAHRQPERWELVDGAARMMTGGTPNHARLSRNALVALVAGLGGGRCEAFGPDLAVILGPGHVLFPDASVSCEPVGALGAASPVVIIEVLSPSTASHDLGDKASAYRRLPSLRHLVLVRQDRVGVQHFHREEAGRDFSLTEIDTVDGRLVLAAIGVGMDLATLYAGVSLAG